MPHLYRKIPDVLKERPNWVVWGVPDAPPKAPFNPKSLLTGRPEPAKANWDLYTNAVDCVNCRLAEGIGFEFEVNDLYGVDLDHVIDEHGALMPEAQLIVDKLDLYTEISPILKSWCRRFSQAHTMPRKTKHTLKNADAPITCPEPQRTHAQLRILQRLRITSVTKTGKT